MTHTPGISAAGGVGNASGANGTVYCSDTYYVNFTVYPTEVHQNAAEQEGPFQVTLQDAAGSGGTPVTAPVDVVLDLSVEGLDPNSTLFYDANGEQITQITIPAGSSVTPEFFYRHLGEPGMLTFTAENTDVGISDSQELNCLSSVSTFRIEPLDGDYSRKAGAPFDLQITALDEDGNTATSYTPQTSLLLSIAAQSPTEGVGAFTPATTESCTFSEGICTIVGATYSECGYITVTVTDQDLQKSGVTAQPFIFYPHSFSVVAETSELTVNQPFSMTVSPLNASGQKCLYYKNDSNLTLEYVNPSGDQGGLLGTSEIRSDLWTTDTVEITRQIYDKWGAVKIKVVDESYEDSVGTSEEIFFNPKDFLVTPSTPPADRTFYYVNEPFDILVRARDYNGTLISNYQGTLTITSTGLEEALTEYVFLSADQGEHTFTGLYGTSDGNATYGVLDNVYTAITGTSGNIAIEDASIRVSSGSGPANDPLSLQVKIYDSDGTIITQDQTTSFTVTLLETPDQNGTATCSATVSAVTVEDGIATIQVTDTEAGTVTVLPVSTPELIPIAGTATFGGFKGGGVAFEMWREIRDSHKKRELT